MKKIHFVYRQSVLVYFNWLFCCLSSSFYISPCVNHPFPHSNDNSSTVSLTPLVKNAGILSTQAFCRLPITWRHSQRSHYHHNASIGTVTMSMKCLTDFHWHDNGPQGVIMSSMRVPEWLRCQWECYFNVTADRSCKNSTIVMEIK